MLSALLLAAATPLTAVADSYPDLSPDGRQLLFTSNRSGKSAIWIAAADGSGARLLFDGGTVGTSPETPRWSPDGTHIVFVMAPVGEDGGNAVEIYRMAADATNVRQLTATPGDDSHPHWSGDGKRIYFNSARATPDLSLPWLRQWHDIYSMAADGSDVRRHSECKSVCTYPTPSPDGQWLAYRRVTDTPGMSWDLTAAMRNSEVFVAKADGSSPVNISNSDAFDGWPIWSPDSRWIAFASNRGRIQAVGQVFAVRPDGSGLRQLTDGLMSHVQPSFAPDGKSLLVYRNVEGDSEIGL
jgi:TolB protein